MTEQEEITIKLPADHMKYLSDVAELSGVTVEHVVNVILAMHILREKS